MRQEPAPSYVHSKQRCDPRQSRRLHWKQLEWS